MSFLPQVIHLLETLIRNVYLLCAHPLIYFGIKKIINQPGFGNYTKEIHKQTTSLLLSFFPNSPEPVVWFLPNQTWFSLSFQRPQQMARAFSTNGYKVIFCEPWRMQETLTSIPSVQLNRIQGLIEIEPNLYLLRCPSSFIRYYLSATNPSITIMHWPYQAVFIPPSLKNKVIYEIIDDHTLIPSFKQKWGRIHDKWVKQAKLLITTADDLHGSYSLIRSDTLLIPNGVNYTDWASNSVLSIPPDLVPAVSKKAIIGYYGSIADWFDWDVWNYAAMKNPDWAFVLLGVPYNGDYQSINNQIKDFENIYYLGAKPYNELPQYLHHFDVATIPFKINDITNACSPVKLFEYMAAKKPIVTTNFREVQKYQSVLIAKDKFEFAEKIKQALALRNDTQYLSTLQSEAMNNTWINRVKTIDILIRNET